MASYSEKDIQHFSGLQGVRKRPEMYIGPTDSHGLFTIIREALDNSVDEAIAGRNDLVYLHTDKDGEIWVADNGAGIPVGKHSSGVNTLTLVLTELHAGGKFSASAYKKSRGVHGVGIKAAVALSEFFEIWTYRSGSWWHTSFKRGVEKSKPTKNAPPKKIGSHKPKKGTVVHFIPDSTIFGKSKLSTSALLTWAKVSSYLNPGLRLIVDFNGKPQEFYSKNGPIDLLRDWAKDAKLEVRDVFTLNSPSVDIAVMFTTGESESIEVRGYTNGLLNSSGGTHISTFFKTLTDVLGEFASTKHSYTPTDIKDGVFGIINIKLDLPTFGGQTKDSLVDERAKEIEPELSKALRKFFSKNKSLTKSILDRATQLHSLKSEFTANKKLIAKLRPKKGGSLLPGKLATALNCPISKRELYLVEGDSAAGTAKKARFKEYQEVLPLRGKLLNVMRDKKDPLDSEAIILILQSIGFNPKERDPFSKLRVGKIVILSDADVDGSHIAALIMALFAKYLPALFDNGMVFAAKGAEYILEYKNKKYYTNSLDDLKSELEVDKLPPGVRHIKGLGEMNEHELRHTAFDPKTRELIALTSLSRKDAKEFKLLMGEDVTYRRKLLGLDD